MKCPHCKYVSFEYLDTCRKCSRDLSAHKSQYGIDFIKPISLDLLAFVDAEQAYGQDASSAIAIVGEETTADTDEGDSFSIDMGEDSGAGGTVTYDGVDETASEDELEFSLDDSTSGITLGDSDEEMDSIEVSGPETGVEPEVAVVEEESPFEESSEIASDSGFSLGLGEDLEAGEGLNFDDVESEAQANAPQVAKEANDEISLGAADDDFDDIELSTDEKEIFADTNDSSADLDLDALDLGLDDEGPELQKG